jgi:hypothetical protein
MSEALGRMYAQNIRVFDVGPFGAFNTTYQAIRRRPTKPRLEGKLLPVLKAWHFTSN